MLSGVVDVPVRLAAVTEPEMVIVFFCTPSIVSVYLSV